MRIFFVLTLSTISLVKGEKCFAPMICNNVPTWARISRAGEGGTCGNEMKQLEDKAKNLASAMDKMIERAEEWKNIQSATMPVTAVENTKETSSHSLETEKEENKKLTTQDVDKTTSEPSITRGTETTEEITTPGMSTRVETTTVAGSCPLPLRRGNGYADVDPDRTLYLPGDTVTYRCNTGYSEVGDMQLTCQNNYLWSPVEFVCVNKKNCGAPEDIDNGGYSGRDFTFGGSVTYYCNTGYDLQGQRVQRCMSEEEWEPGRPYATCKIRTCPAPANLLNGDVDIQTAPDLEYDQTISYSCNKGYQLKGPSTGRCNENGNWGVVPECTIAVACDEGKGYGGKCFWAEVHTRLDVDYNESVRICREKSGKPADILDAQHYDMMLEYIRSLMSSFWSYVHIWLGMNIDPGTKIVRLSNGNQSLYLRYNPGFPSFDSSHTQMLIVVRKSKSDEENQGMWNWTPSYKAHGVLCQKE